MSKFTIEYNVRSWQDDEGQWHEYSIAIHGKKTVEADNISMATKNVIQGMRNTGHYAIPLKSYRAVEDA
jgi:hypothetical protein